MLRVKPISFKVACEFIKAHHRHNKPPRGMKFCVGVMKDDKLVGVMTAGRPVARAYDDGWTLEVNRTCTDGTALNANSMLYGAARRIAKAMGYHRLITYTQADEHGASLKAAGFVKVKDLKPRKNWAESSKKLKEIRDHSEPSNVARTLWEIRFAAQAA